MSELDDFDAAEIASAWHSVNTWNDPGVAMYSVASTGRVYSEEHRENLIAYIETCLRQAVKLDEDTESNPPVLADRHETNVEELEALREWAHDYQIRKED
jgi:hypothetical protein